MTLLFDFPHRPGCECEACSIQRLADANAAGMNLVLDSIFGPDVTGPPALRLLGSADGPDEGSLDGTEDKGTGAARV